MGELYKSLTRNMNLLPVANAIGDYVKKKRQQEKMQEFLNLLQGTKRGMGNLYDDNPSDYHKGKQPQPTPSPMGMNIPDLNFEEDKQIPVNTTRRNSLASQLFDTGQMENAPGTGDTKQPSSLTEKVPERFGTQEQPETDYEVDYGEANKDANRMLTDYMMKMLKFQGDDIPPEMKQQGLAMLQQLMKGEQPEEPGEIKYNVDPTKNVMQDGKIIHEGKADVDKKKTPDFEVSEDGYYMYWDNNANEGKGGWTKTKEKAPKKQSDQSLGWAKFMDKMEQDEKDEAEKTRQAQIDYNDIMSSEWVEMKDLLRRGLIEEDDPAAKYDSETKKYKKGGGYVVRDDKGKLKLIYSNKSLEDYAKHRVGHAPDRWSRKKKLTQSDFISDFEKEEGRKPTKTEIKRAKEKGYWK